MNHIDSDPTSAWGIVKSNQASYNTKDKRFFVVDNFYQDPHAIRDLALNQPFFPGEGAVGSRTRKQFLFEGLKESFEEILQEKIQDHTPEGTGWYDVGINGRFQSCPGGTPSVFHCDSQKWAAVIYLTPDAPPEGGTSFYRHKATKVHHNSQIDWSLKDEDNVFNQKTFLDPSPYEQVDTVGNIFNRLVIFDGGLIHSGVNYFGWDLHTSRLFHIFFFS